MFVVADDSDIFLSLPKQYNKIGHHCLLPSFLLLNIHDHLHNSSDAV